MKMRNAFAWTVGLAVLAPSQAEAQQDPTLIGQGAQLYSTTCIRCHNARSGSERTDGEWVAIIAHMRARANMSKSQAAAVLAFLQATNIPEGGTPTASIPKMWTDVPNAPRATDGKAKPKQPQRRNNQ